MFTYGKETLNGSKEVFKLRGVKKLEKEGKKERSKKRVP